jgi:hypothetical protein
MIGRFCLGFGGRRNLWRENEEPHYPRRQIECCLGLRFSGVGMVGALKKFLDSLNYTIVKVVGRRAGGTCLCKLVDGGSVERWRELWCRESAGILFSLRRLASPIISKRTLEVCRSLRHYAMEINKKVVSNNKKRL